MNSIHNVNWYWAYAFWITRYQRDSFLNTGRFTECVYMRWNIFHCLHVLKLYGFIFRFLSGLRLVHGITKKDKKTLKLLLRLENYKKMISYERIVFEPHQKYCTYSSLHFEIRLILFISWEKWKKKMILYASIDKEKNVSIIHLTNFPAYKVEHTFNAQKLYSFKAFACAWAFEWKEI